MTYNDWLDEDQPRHEDRTLLKDWRFYLALTALAAIAVAICLAFPVGQARAGAQSELVTDYANYPDTPQAHLPDGCDGGGLFHSEQFSLNGGLAVGDPHQLPEFHAGDELTMDWDATTPECVGAPVVLVVKVAQDPFFDPGDDQFAYVPYAATTADGGPGSLTYPLPGLAEFGHQCAYQFDAIVGLPLAVVGPGGSDYSASVRHDDRRTTLIDYRNGAYENCVAEQTTTTTGPPETTTTAPPEATTTTPAPTTTEAPVVTTESTSLAPSPATNDQAAAAAATRGRLAVTGAEPLTPALGIFGGLIIFLGALLVVKTRRTHPLPRVHRRHQP